MLDIQTEQHELGQGQVELYEAVVSLKRRHDLHPCAVRPRDGLALRRDSEREVVQDLVKRFRSLPVDQQRRLPALLNSLAQLEIVVGDLAAGQEDFQEVARLVSDPISQAEANHNVYRTALERRDWTTALAALRRAVALDSDAFEIFPLEGYEPERILGAGGAGVTFLCQERPSGRKVVVKSLRPDSLDRDIGTLFRELSWMQELDHPGLIRILDFAQSEAEPVRAYLAMEYFPGQSLAEYVAVNGPLAPQDWLEVACQLARSLQVLHGRGVLHRCLWPGSVLLRRDQPDDGPSRWRVKLLDAGLGLKRTLIHASASHPAAQAQTSLGRSVARIVDFAPPEVIGKPKGQVWIGPHSDVYSFGKVCAFALLGRPDPDGSQRSVLSDAWNQFLDDCCHWIMGRRPADFSSVLTRLPMLCADPFDLITRIERDQYQEAIAEQTQALEQEPDNIALYVRRATLYAHQGDMGLALADLSQALERSPQNADIFRQRGVAHVHEGHLDQAIGDFTEAIRLEPRHAETFANRALAYAKKNDHARAIADFNEALRIEPGNEMVLYNRAGAYLALGELQRSLEGYSEVIRANPRHRWAFGNRGKIYTQMGLPLKAIQDFTRVLQLQPGHVKALADRAQAYLALKQHDRAMADFNEAIRLEPGPTLYTDRGLAHALHGDLDKAIADFSAALATHPLSGTALLFRGHAYLDRNELPPALADLNEAIRLQPQSAAAHYYRAQVQARLGQREPALADGTEALRLEPGHAGALFLRGRLLAEGDALAEACADFSALLDRDWGHVGARVERGKVYRRLGEDDKALADFNTAVLADRPSAEAYRLRAELYRDQGNVEQALADFNEAIKLDNGQAWTYLQRGQLLAQQGDREAALGDINTALRLDPGQPRAYLQRVMLSVEMGQHDAALADLAEVVRLEPELAPAYAARARIHLTQGHPDQALADLNDYLRLDPTDPAGYHLRGQVQALLGRHDLAIADNQEAERLDSENPLTLNNLAWLWAACPRADLRDPARAVEYARKACEATGWQNPGILDTLAVALAATGQFAEACQRLRQALELVRPDDQAMLQKRLALFESGQAYVET